MAKRVMVTSALTEDMIIAGARLLKDLDDAGVEVQDALWIHQPESQTWRLIIAMPALKTRGPLQAYRRILEVESTLTANKLTVGVENISVVDTKDPLIGALRKANSIHPLTESRQPRMVLSGIYFEESYIYRVAEPSSITTES